LLFRQLEYFVALAQERHFAKAAAVCYVSQPALSEAIRKLEHELGVPLVNRGRAFEGLTPEGERLVIWARRILADHDALKQEVVAMQSGLQGRLRLSVIPMASTTASLLLEPFCAAHPLVSVSLETAQPSSEILDRLDRFELDAGIILLEGSDYEGRATATRLYGEQMVLVASRQLVPDSIERLAWSEVSQIPLCALNSTMRGRILVNEALAAHDVVLRPEIETDSVASIYSLAFTGRWAGVVPNGWFHAFPRSADVRLVPLVEPLITFTVAVVTARSEPASVLGRAFGACAETKALEEFFAVTTPTQRLGRASTPTD
jgi:DNA-binding transcriptional LysR family regulator